MLKIKYSRIVWVLVVLAFFIQSCNSSSSDPSGWSAKGTPVLTEVIFPETSEAVSEMADTIIADSSAEVQKIKDASPRTFENTVVAFDSVMNEGYKRLNTLQALSYLSPDEGIREAAAEAILRTAEWFYMTMNDPELLNAMAAFENMKSQFQGEDLTLINRTLSGLKEYGLGKTADERARLQQINLSIEIYKRAILSNIINDVPDEENPPLLADLVRARSAQAMLLGYDSFGAYINSQRMAGTPEVATAFLQNISDRLAPAFASELEMSLEMKKALTGNADARNDYRDVVKYQNASIEKRFGISDLYSGHMFELEHARDTLFLISKEIFGIAISPAVPPGPVWHEDVRFYTATDVATGKPMGSFYMDLFKREGKSDHPKIVPVISSHLGKDGLWSRPLFVYVFDLNPPDGSTPVMISMDDAEGLFHEFGHALQHLCSTSIYFATDSKALGADFMETHSQLLEQWLTDPSVLALMSGGSGDLTPEELAVRKEAGNVLSVVLDRYAVALSMTDLGLYTQYTDTSIIDPVAVFNDMLSSFFVPYAGNTWQVNPLEHMAESMPGQYYCYLWSKAISKDLGSRFSTSKSGFMNPDLGMEIRNKFFEFDASKNPEAAIRSFLGRDWRTDAYFESLGIQY